MGGGTLLNGCPAQGGAVLGGVPRSMGALLRGVPCSWEQAPFKGPWEQLTPLCNKARPRWIGLA